MFEGFRDVLDRFTHFLDERQIHLQGQHTIPVLLLERIVKFLAQLLLTIGLKTKLMMKEGRVGQ